VVITPSELAQPIFGYGFLAMILRICHFTNNRGTLPGLIKGHGKNLKPKSQCPLRSPYLLTINDLAC
jgi:hypothetical protein